MATPGRSEGLEALELHLGPLAKEVVLGEGTGGDTLARIAAVPHTRVGLYLSGGNTLAPEDVARLSRLERVHLYLTDPLLPVHLEVLRKVRARRTLTVVVPAGRSPDPQLPARLAQAGPTGIQVLLEGRATLERLAALEGLRHGEIGLRLPAGGFEPGLEAHLGPWAGRLFVVVPAEAGAPAVEALAGLRPRRLVLETSGNRVAPAVLTAASGLGLPLEVRLDGRVGPRDLAALQGVAGLSLTIWAPERRELAEGVTDLLVRSEGETPRRR